MQKPLKIVRFGDTTECKIKFGYLNGDYGEKSSPKRVLLYPVKFNISFRS